MLNIGEFARLGQVSPRMLRHYDEIGLLQPQNVDAVNGYRSYAVHQLGRLHQIVALRDMGFTLAQTGDVLNEGLSMDQLRGMLRLREAQIESTVAEEEGRLRRVAAHLRAIERTCVVKLQDVVIKRTGSWRLAEGRRTSPGFGSENLGPLFGELVPEVLTELSTQGVDPGLLVAHYEEPKDDGSVVLHAGFAIDRQVVKETDRVQVLELPGAEVASLIHRGSMDDVLPVYESLVRWIEDSGYRLTGQSREIYHECMAEDVNDNICEIQFPVARADAP
jgi:DNA-binding transcriptional MerR regulator/effector-binding domain-containing protein